MVQQPPNKRQVRLEIPNTLNAIYSNAVVISHTQNEIIFDFTQIMPNDPRARVQSRIVMTPTSAKSLLRALQANLDRFEERNGEIQLPPSLADQLFSSMRPDEDENDGEEPTNG